VAGAGDAEQGHAAAGAGPPADRAGHHRQLRLPRLVQVGARPPTPLSTQLCRVCQVCVTVCRWGWAVGQV
jgi:hypothetical protein